MQPNSLYQTLSVGTRCLALVLCLWLPSVYAADKPLNVLLLSPSANPWNEQTTDGVHSHFIEEGHRVVVHREVVNPSGRRGVPALTVEQLNARYANANIDYVIATTPTEGMLPYLKKAGNQLLPNAIKVYQGKSGRTFKATQSLDAPNVITVERPVLMDKALEQALQLHQPKQLYLFANPQSSDYLDKTLIAAVEALKQQGVLTAQINYMPLMSTQGYIDYLRAQPAKDGMVFFTAKFKDANGPVVPAVMINFIAAGIDMPVVPYFGSMLNGNGLVGGYLQQPFMYGELLADVVLEHQHGRLFDYDTYRANHSEEERANYPVIPMHQNIFDDAQLHRLGIAHRTLPDNAIIINEQDVRFVPGNYVTEIALVVVAFIVSIIAILIYMVRSRTASLKRAEQKLSLANQQLSSDLFKSQQRALHIQTNLNETGVGLIILSLETGKVLDANQKWADTLGYSLEELKQLSLSDIDPSIPEHKIEKAFKGIQRDGKRHLQSRQRTKDGRLVDVDISLVVAEATDDLPAHIVSFVVDISEEKAQATRLQQMYSAMAASRTGYVVLSLDGVKVLDLNSAMADLWGLSKEEALKLEIKDIDALKTPDEVQQAALAVKQAGMLTFTSMHKRKFGEPIDVEVTAIYQPENTEFAESVVCFVRDISVTRKAQKEAQKQQAYFSTVFDSLGASGMGVWMLSYDTKRLVDCTDTFAEGLGYTREEALKAPVENILTLFSPSVIERAEELSHKRKDLTYPHFEVRTKQGEKKIHRVATYAWSESPWGKNVLVGISSDVTEQARMTQETKERGQQLQAIFDTAPFAIYIASRDGGIRWCNDNACELFGLVDKQLTATSLNQLMEPASYQQFEQDLKQALKVNELLDLDVSIKHSTKGIVPVRVMGRSVMHDGEQAVIYFAVDQSERVAKENELRRLSDENLQQAQRFREYLDTSPVAISLVEGDSAGKRKVMYVNRAWQDLLGYSLDEMQGESTKHLYLDEESFTAASNALNDAIESNKAWDFEAQQKRKDGSVFNARIQGRYLVTDDKIRGINFVQDLTRQQAYEQALIEARDQAEAAAQAKSSFLANMSHEIRTPMNAILSMSELLLEVTSSDEERDMARLIDNGAKDLLGILNQVLDLSRIDSGSYQLHLEPSNVALLIEDTAKLFEAQAFKKDLEFVVDAPINTTPRLADPQLIRQVLSNLIGNAIKFTEEGTILIRAKLTPSNDTTDLLEIDVIDTGVGMSEEQQKVVFERFEQADASTTRKFGGTGLGLTITRELIVLMGGDISLISSLGEGSRFHVSLPLRHVIEESVTVHQLPQLDSLKGNVLVVDDIESNRMALSRLLELMGLQAATVANASSAITALAKQPFDVVITDLHMPNASGLELLEMIRSGIHPKIDKQIPVVFLTADVMSEEKDKAEGMGISGWLNKPVSKAEVSQILGVILSGKGTVDLQPITVKDDTRDKSALMAWNRAEMAERMVDDDVLLNNICSLFLDNLPQLQSTIQVAYSSRDAEEGAVQAHTLKGAAANASAEQLHAVAKSLESAFRAVNWERVERYVKELPEAIRVTEEAMRAHQKRSQS